MSFMLSAILRTETRMRKELVKDKDGVVDQLIVEIERCAKRSIEKTGVFRIGVSGGSVVSFLCAAIPRLSAECDLGKWRIYFCDERYVDESDPESTFGCYKNTVVPNTPLKIEQFVPIDFTLPLEECARDYERKIREDFKVTDVDKVPAFDFLLLGLGPDGHTCSLFPGHKLLQERKQLVAAISDSPKPPPQRITMTLQLLTKAHCVVFTITGANKAEVVQSILDHGEKLPGGLVYPIFGELIWILDDEAGRLVPYDELP